MARSTNRSRARQNPKNRSLNAFAIAQSQVKEKPTVAAHRLGQAPPESKKRVRKGDGGGENEGEEEGEPRNGGGRRGDDNENVEGGSDEESGQWRVGVDSNDESDIDSDEAMGESDEERFADFTFRGSGSTGRSKQGKGKAREVDLGESEEDEDDESEDGEGFVNLSEMLDRAEASSGDEEVTRELNSKKRAAPVDEKEGGEDEDEDDDSMSSAVDELTNGDDSDADSFTNFSEAEDDTSEDPTKLAALQSLISSLPSSISEPPAKRVRLDDPNEGKIPNEYNLSLNSASQKLTIEDLIPSITDPKLKKALKVLSDTNPAGTKKDGVQGKLSAPLAKRQQDKLDRAAAYVETNKTLDRWVDTVKQNREADHIYFPLANALNAPIKAPSRLPTITPSNSTPLTALESTISGILKESNMVSDQQIEEFEELKINHLSIREVQRRTAELRMARELLYREELKAKRIKKIKSKAYHRIHKKERMKQEQAIEEALALERGGVPGEDETMEQERKRAEERMTLRHKQSKWAKEMKESGRTVWDEEAQDGAIEMARRADELKRRIRGKDVREGDGEFDESSSEEGGDEFDEEGVGMRKKLLKDIEGAEADLGVAVGGSKKLGGRLLGMKFMQAAEAARKKGNDAALEELRNSLEGRDKINDEEDSHAEEVKQASGRMIFKPGKKDDQLATPKSEFTELDQSTNEEEDDEVTFINKASAASNAPKNPFSAPKTTVEGKHVSFRGDKDDDNSVALPANPWLSQGSNAALVKPKQQALISGRKESKDERANSKLAKNRTAALKNNPTENDEVEIDTTVTLKLVSKKLVDPDDDGDDEEANDKEINLISTKGSKGTSQNQRELVKLAFAGDNVVVDFATEKKKVAEDEDNKVVDEILPGWGCWTGAGLVPRPPSKRFLKTIKGIDKDKRKDTKLAKVIINEKRVKKVPSPNPHHCDPLC